MLGTKSEALTLIVFLFIALILPDNCLSKASGETKGKEDKMRNVEIVKWRRREKKRSIQKP